MRPFLFFLQNVQWPLRSSNNKHLRSCEWEVIESGPECRFAIRMQSENGTWKTHKLIYEVSPGLFPRDQASTVNHIVANPKTIQALLDFFSTKVNGELTMICTRRGCSLSSRGDESIDHRQRNLLQTEVHVEKESFETYEIGQEVEMTFSLREFRAPVALADHLQCTLEMRFETAGYPINMEIKVDGMTAQIFLATSEPDVPRLKNLNQSVSTNTSMVGGTDPLINAVNANVAIPNSQTHPAVEEQQSDELPSHQPMESTALPAPVECIGKDDAPNASQAKDYEQVHNEQMAGSTDTNLSSLRQDGATTYEEDEQARRESGNDVDYDDDNSSTFSGNEEFVPGTQDQDSSNKRMRYNPLL